MPVTLPCLLHCNGLLWSEIDTFNIFSCIRCNINIAWIFALCLLTCKLFSPSFNKLTSYGKLASYPVSNILPNRHYFQILIYPRYRFLTQKRVFTFVYTFSFFWTLLLFLAAIYILSQDQIMNLDFLHKSSRSMKKQEIAVKEFGKDKHFATLEPFSVQFLRKITLVIRTSVFIKRATLQTLLILAHLGRRSLECFYVHRFSIRHMSLLNVALMWAFYIFMPVTLLIDLMTKHANISIKDEALNSDNLMENNTMSLTFSNWKVVFSVFLWTWSSYEQNKAHRILSHLRSGCDTEPCKRNIQKLEEQTKIKASVSNQLLNNKTTEFSTELNNVDCQGHSKPLFFLPKKAMFNLISCPHYLFEVMIYFSFLLIAGWTPSVNLMFTFITITMVDLSSKTHFWYQEKFCSSDLGLEASCLKNRKALIPYIW